MRPRRTAQDELAAIARRRLELLSAELAGLRSSLSPPPGPVEETEPTVPAVPSAPGSAPDPPVVGLEGLSSWEAVQVERGRHALRPVSAGGRVGGWLHDRLPPTLQGRVRLTAGNVSVVTLLVAVSLAVTAWWVVRAEDPGAAAPAAAWADTVEGTSSPGPLVTPVADPSAGASASGAAVVVVDVTGKVRRPGIATLPVGSRVVDALEAAGGPRRGVDLATLNLARVLVDGEQIVVGVPAPAGLAAPAASALGGAAAGEGPMVNINSATQTELEELPGVGPVTATAILQWRTDNGAFTAVDELLEVSGIGDVTLAEIAPFVTL